MIKIIDIIEDSPAAAVGALPGDILVSLNENEINDFLDYQFYQSEEDLELHVRRDGLDLYSPLEKNYDEELGLVLEQPVIRGCANK